VLVTSAAHAGRLVTDIDLTIDELTGQVTAHHADNVIVTRTVPKDPAQSALIAHYQVFAAPLANRVVGSASADFTRAVAPAIESVMGNLIADAQLDGTRGEGAVAAFMNPGGVRADILRSPSGRDRR
jgi:5'-nucleotidase